MRNEFERMQRQRRRGLAVMLAAIIPFASVMLVLSIVGEGSESAQGPSLPSASMVGPSPSPTLSPSIETLEAAAAIQLVALKSGDVDQANELLDRFKDQWRNCEFLVQAWRADGARALGAEIAAFRETVLINPPYSVPVVGVATAGGRKNGYVANAIAASCR